MCGGATGTGGGLSKLDPIGKAGTNNSVFGDPFNLYHGSPDPNAAANAAAKAEADRQAQIQKSMDSVNALFGGPARQAQYDQYSKDTFNLLKDSLDQNERSTARNLNFGLLRTGNIGGSEDIAQHGRLQQDYNQGLLDASNKSQGAEQQLKAEDYNLESNLDKLILGGMSTTTAEQQADQGLAANIAGASSLVAPSTMDTAFGDLANAYLKGKAQQGVTQANGAVPLSSAFMTQAPAPVPAEDPGAQWGAQWLDLGGPS